MALVSSPMVLLGVSGSFYRWGLKRKTPEGMSAKGMVESWPLWPTPGCS